MEVQKSVNIKEFEEFIKFVKKLKDKKVPFAFNGTLDVNNNQRYSVNWTEEEAV